MGYAAKHQAVLGEVTVNPGIAYEVHIYNEETMATGVFEVFVGVELANDAQAPLDTVIKVLPATQYAVFTLKGEAIVGDWPMAIYQEWLPNSAYEASHEFHIQYHDGSFKGFDRLAESSLDVYVPVQLRA